MVDEENQESTERPQEATQPVAKGGSGMEPNIAGALSYVLGLVTGIIFLGIESENKFVRFHAMQSIFFSVVVIIGNIVFGIIPVLGWIMGALFNLASLAVWLLLMYKAYLNEEWELPVIGDLARQQVNK